MSETADSAPAPAPAPAPAAAAAPSAPKEKENKPPEFEPPQACIQRIVKAVLPDNIQIGKDAKAAFARAAGIFIMYLTACANDFCRESKRQTITGPDVMMAISELEFHDLVEPLKDFLEEFRKEQSAQKQAAKEKKEADAAENAKDGAGEGAEEGKESEATAMDTDEAAKSTDS
uniref:Transcription factor CBF/NF-Y/archaeal histone domain-containing protein n=1 Tax=Heterosigma akashiwo TaxID=2829 RepID=A0A6V1RK43_HETAK|mmetsp:Transcript_26625/g.41780  ORF Transcript_26625/g.41780 Transcript_26625/m.41780 type:complete len:174 (+) Transcript_26625:46-567(+)